MRLLLLMCCLATVAMAAEMGPGRSIAVTGTAQADLAPDGVRWTVSLRHVAKDQPTARAEHRAGLAALVKALTAIGLAEAEVQRFATLQGVEWVSAPQGQVRDGFYQQTGLRVVVKDLAHMEAVQDALAADPAVTVQDMVFTRSDEAAQRVTLRTQALHAARVKAVAMAAALDAVVGQPRSIAEAQPDAPWSNRAFNGAVADEVGPGASPGAVRLSVSVDVAFDLVPR